MADDAIARLRGLLTAVDERLVAGINERLRLVRELKAVKEDQGVAFLDPAREQWMLDHLAGANAGPLTAEGLREIYAELLALTKRELGRSRG